eukprot:scaffold45054_cov139-Skeletonema_marinoi.AAC.1
MAMVSTRPTTIQGSFRVAAKTCCVGGSVGNDLIACGRMGSRRASGGGCRRITKKQQCNAKRNCEWRQQRCRRRVGGTTTTSSTPTTNIGPITGGELSPSIAAALTSRLERVDIFDICLCNNAHEPCVKATVDAIGDFIHGGNGCIRVQLKVAGGTATLAFTAEDNCVCANAAVVLAPPMFPYGGKNCECFVI